MLQHQHTSRFQIKMQMIPYIPTYAKTDEEQILLILLCVALPCLMALALLIQSILDDTSSDAVKHGDEDEEEDEEEAEEMPSGPIVSYEKPTLRPRPTKAAKTDNMDILDKPILGFLWHWPGATAKEISTALRSIPGGAEKSLINSRLYTLMNKGFVKKAQGSGSSPRWLPNRGPEFNTMVFGK